MTTLGVDNISNLTRVLGEYDCTDFIKNGYSRSEIDYYQINLDREKFAISEGKFHCVYTSFYTQKVLYDKLGSWDEIIYYNDNQNEKLLWKNIKLLPEIDKEFTIAATGREDNYDIYSSIIVFDSKGQDMLKAGNPLAQKIMDTIGAMIKNNDEPDKDFYNFYQEDVGQY